MNTPDQVGGQFLTFEVVASVESKVRVSAIFPVYLTLSDSSDSSAHSWEFFVRIDLLPTDHKQVRVDFLQIDSDGEYEFRTQCRPIMRAGEFFRPDNSYFKSTAAEFNSKIAELRSVIDAVPLK